MPARSEAQQRFMGADLARAQRGERTVTGMSTSQLRDFARSPSPSSYARTATRALRRASRSNGRR